MQSRVDMEQALQIRLLTANNSGLVPTTRITQEIQDATLWAGSLHWWPALQRARQSTAAKNTQNLTYDYYDYPPDFLTDSISRLYIDGKKYKPKAFQDVLDYSDSSLNSTLAPNPQVRIFANYGRQYFVFPSYTGIAPAGNLIIWGNIQHPKLLLPTDLTIFSQWDDTGNEAIVKKAMAVILKRIDPGVAQAEEQDAIGLLGLIWKTVTDGMQKAQRLNHQMFDVPDYFGGGGGLSTIGNFSTPINEEEAF